MPAETTEDISVATLTATSAPDPVPPLAMAELAVWARHFWNAWWLIPILSTVIVPSGRAGTYGLAEFLLLLLAHACGNHTHLRQTLREVRPFAQEVMALWAREDMPSQAQLSRWLARIDDAALEAWRTLFCPT